MRRLHVLHVIGGGDTGGAMSHLLPLLSGLQTLECDVHLLCLGEGGLAEAAKSRGVPVRVLPMRNAWDTSALLPLRRAVAEGPWWDADGRDRQDMHPWDVVHTHGMRANLPVRLAMSRGRRRPCLFTTVHSDLLLDYASPVLARTYQALDLATIRLVDTIVCVSDGLRTLLVERGYPRDRMVRIWSGIEGSPAFGEAAGEAVSAVEGSGDAPESAERRLRIGTVARLAPVKDLGLLLEVADRLRRTFPGLECLIVGDGPERPGLEAATRDLGLSEVVRFTGRVEGVGPILATLDVFVVTSIFEGGVSMSVLEAMAAGLPVVTTAAGGVAEAVQDGETGFVVARDGERGALAAALAERAAALLADEDLRRRMGAAGAARVRDLFLAERTAARTLRAYERCLAGRGEPA